MLKPARRIPSHIGRPGGATCVGSGRPVTRTASRRGASTKSGPTTPPRAHKCAVCGNYVPVGPSGRVQAHTNKRGGGKCTGSRRKVASSLSPQRPPSPGEGAKGSGESRSGPSISASQGQQQGRRRGKCRLCGAGVAYDQDLRMRQHGFAGGEAECPASDREFGWVPESIEEGMPTRLIGGGKVPSRELEQVRRVVTRSVSAKLEQKRSAAQVAARGDAAKLAKRRKRNSGTGSALVTVRCASCGFDFERPVDETTRRCSICAPRGGTSVRAYGGGLPGLGRRS